MSYFRYLRTVFGFPSLVLGILFVLSGLYAQGKYQEANIALGIGILLLVANVLGYLFYARKA